MPFQPGNRFGKAGRPPLALRRPELLLPLVFQAGGVSWTKDYIRLYTKQRDKGQLSSSEKATFKLLNDLMPYLCTTIKLKEIDPNGAPARDMEESKVFAEQAQKLIQQLNENGADTGTKKAGD